MPADNFNNLIGLISNFDLMESISIPVIALSDISAVEIVLNIVVMPKVIGGIDEGSPHIFLWIK